MVLTYLFFKLEQFIVFIHNRLVVRVHAPNPNRRFRRATGFLQRTEDAVPTTTNTTTSTTTTTTTTTTTIATTTTTATAAAACKLVMASSALFPRTICCFGHGYVRSVTWLHTSKSLPQICWRNVVAQTHPKSSSDGSLQRAPQPPWVED